MKRGIELKNMDTGEPLPPSAPKSSGPTCTSGRFQWPKRWVSAPKS